MMMRRFHLARSGRFATVSRTQGSDCTADDFRCLGCPLINDASLFFKMAHGRFLIARSFRRLSYLSTIPFHAFQHSVDFTFSRRAARCPSGHYSLMTMAISTLDACRLGGRIEMAEYSVYLFPYELTICDVFTQHFIVSLSQGLHYQGIYMLMHW